jgi:O-Antigen ligase
VIDASRAFPLFAGAPGVAAPGLGRRVSGERLAVATTALAVAMLPLAVPTGPANAAPIDILIAVALGASLLWASTAGIRLRFPYALPVAILMFGGALGGLAGFVPELAVVALVQDLVLLVWCWTLVNVAHSPANLRTILATWAYSGIAWAIIAFIGLATGASVLTGHIERQGTRVQITLADPSYAANYFFVSMMIIWATRRPRHRVVRLAAYALLVAAMATTGSNSGMVALVVGSVVATTLGIYRRFGIGPTISALAAVALSAFAVPSSVGLEGVQGAAHESRWAFMREGIGRSPQSAGQREMLLQESVRLYRTGTPLGAGPVSTKPRLRREMVPLVKEAHNDYFAALLERGVLGFLGVFLLVSAIAVRAVSLITTRLGEAFAATVSRPNALVAAVAGTFVAGTVYELFHVRHVWSLFALVAALSIWGRE